MEKHLDLNARTIDFGKIAIEELGKITENLPFGLAIAAIKKGFKVTRKGWNNKNVFLVLIVPRNEYEKAYIQGDEFPVLPWVGIKTADDKFVPWLPNQVDILAEDWEMIEGKA